MILLKLLRSFLLLLTLAQQNVMAQITIGNLNWQTADLTNTLFLRQFGAFTTAIGNVTTGENFGSSVDGLAGLTSGKIDVILECWNNTFNPCDRTPGMSSANLGLEARIYLAVPTWALDFAPNMLDLDTWENNTAFQIIGPAVGWSEDALLNDFLDEANYTSIKARLQKFPSEQDMNRAKIQCFKERTNPCLFISWDPDVLSTFLDYAEVDHELWDKYFPLNTLMKVWNPSISTEAALAVQEFQITPAQMSTMTSTFIATGSFTLAEGDEKYTETLLLAVEALFCPGPDCIALSLFPRVKSPDLPDKLVIWTERCLGFAGMPEDNFPLACTQNMPENFQPGGIRGSISGFSVDLLIGPGGILENLGYSPSDITVRCSENVNENLRLISAGLGDLSIGCTTITEPRMRQVDFAMPYLSTGYRLLVKTEYVDPLWVIFTGPVAESVWIAVGIIMAFFSVILFLAENMRDWYDGKRLHSFQETDSQDDRPLSKRFSDFMFKQLSVFAILIGRDGQIDEVETLAGRMIGSCLLLFGVIFFSIWTANLAATLTISQLTDVSGIEDVRGQSVVTMCSEGGDKNFVQQYIETNFPDITVVCVFDDLTEMVDTLNKGDAKAAIWDLEVLKLLANNDCDLEVVGDVFGPQELGFYVPHDSPLHEPLSEAVTFLRFDPLSQDTYNAYFESGVCSSYGKSQNTDSGQLQLENLIGLFMVTLVPAVITLFIQCAYETRRHYKTGLADRANSAVADEKKAKAEAI